MLYIGIVVFLIIKLWPILIIPKNSIGIKQYTYQNELRILTWNIDMAWFNRLISGEPVDILKDKTQAFLKQHDIICMQEFFLLFTNIQPIIDKMKSIGFTYYVLPKIPRIQKMSDSGLAIFSKVPIIYETFIPFQTVRSWNYLNDIGFQYIELYVNDQIISIINTHMQPDHFDIYYDTKKKQQQQIAEIIKHRSIGHPFIICGDFNIILEEYHSMIENFNIEDLQDTSQDLEDRSTFENSVEQYDYIFTNLPYKDTEIVKNEFRSDHYPLCTTLMLN